MKNRGPLLVLFCYFLFGILPIYWKIFVTMDPYFIVGRDPVERARAREIKNHPLCGWSQGVIRKNTPSSIM